MPALLVALPVAIFGAFAVLLLLWAADPLIRKPMTELFRGIPVVGSQLAGNIDITIRFLIGWAERWARSGIGAIVQVIWVPITQLQDTVGSTVAAVEAVAGWLGSVAHNAAQDVAAAVKAAQLAIDRVATQAARITTVAANLADTAARVAHVIAAVIPALEAELRAFIRAQVGGAIDTADVALGRAIDNLRTWTHDRIADAVHPISAELAHLGDLVRGLRVDLGTVTGTIMGLLAPIIALDLLRVIPRIITRIDTMERECVDPMCNVITPQIPTLTGLGDIATLLLVGAMVGEAVHDPEGAAQAVGGVVAGIHDGAAGLAGAFAGIHV